MRLGMKALIVYKSIHHGNTKKVAEAMAQAVGADLIELDQATYDKVAEYDLVGFGSGIYKMKPHAMLLDFIDAAPPIPTKAFIFSTNGSLQAMASRFLAPLKKALQAKGFEVVGEFSCPGWDTFGPLAWIGGYNRGRPNEADLEKARSFAKGLVQ